VLSGHAEQVHAERFSPDDSVVVSADDHTVRIWTVGQKELQRVLAISSAHLAFSPDGTLLAFATLASVVQLRSLQGEVSTDFPAHEHLVTGLAFSPNGRYIATGDGVGYVRLWDIASQRLLVSFRAAPQHVTEPGRPAAAAAELLSFASEGKRLAVVCEDKRGHVQLWEIDSSGTGAQWLAAAAHDLSVWAMGFSPDGRLLAATDFGRNGVHLLDADTLASRGQLLVENEIFKAIAFSPDGRWLALTGAAGTIYIWDLTSRHIVEVLAAHTDGCDWRTNAQIWAIGDIDWAPSGRLIATSGTSPFTHYDLATGRFRGPADYTVKLWEVRTAD
jgi:WD40 repeat protein